MAIPGYRKSSAAPYISFKSFVSLLDELHDKGMPKRVDRPFLEKLPGAKIAPQLVAALRWLELIKGFDSKPTNDFQEIVRSDTRKSALARVLRQQYSDVFEIVDLADCTPEKLDEALQLAFPGEVGTRRRSASFFIQAALFAGIPVDKHLTNQPRMRRGGRAGGSRQSQQTAHLDTPVTRNREPGTADDKNGERCGEGTSGKSVTLRSGGLLAVNYSGDVFRLDRQDREFLFGLLDQLTDYENSNTVAVS